MAKWEFFDLTGIAGGNSVTQYVDPVNGDDANVGSNISPKQSIQGALNTLTGVGTLVLASGTYQEGDFINLPSFVYLIQNGDILMDGTGFASFRLAINGYSVNSHDVDFAVEFTKFRLRILNYNTLFTSNPRYVGVDFDNINNLSMTFTSYNVEDCTFKNITFGNFEFRSGAIFKRNMILNNSTIRVRPDGAPDVTKFISNYVDATSFADLSINEFGINLIDFNHIKGQLQYGANLYADGDAWAASLDATSNGHAANDTLPSSTPAGFNQITDNDYTYSLTAPNGFSDFEGKHIGAFRAGVSTDGLTSTDAQSAVFSYLGTPLAVGVSADGYVETFANGDVGLTAAAPDGEYILESTIVEVAPQARILQNVLVYGEQSVGDGETIDSTDPDAAEGNAFSIDMQFNTNGDVAVGSAIFSNWIKMAYNGKPKVDAVTDAPNYLGNADCIAVGSAADFNASNAAEIECRYVKYRVVLRRFVAEVVTP